MSQNGALEYLKQFLIWPINGDKQLEDIETEIENQKVKLFQAIFSIEDQKQIRTLLNMLRKRHNSLSDKRQCIFNATLEGYAECVYNEFIYIHTIRDIHGKRLWTSFAEADFNVFSKLYSKILQSRLSIEEMRELARTDPWKRHWDIHRSRTMKLPLNDEQQGVVMFTKMYEGAYKNPECPEQKVFDDDDMFDGWMIHQRRERDKDMKEQNIDKVGNIQNKHGDASEVFVIAKSKQDIGNIHDMNHPVARAAKRSREKIIKHKGTAQDLDFPDVKQDLTTKRNEELKQKMKGR